MSLFSGAKQAPVEAVQRLAAIDPRLSMRWVDGVLSYWAITEQWLPNDPRREQIKKGELRADADFDIKGFLPTDCSPAEVEGYIANNWVRVTDARKQAEDIVEGVKAENLKRQAEIHEAFADEQAEKGAKTTKHELEVQAGLATANAQIVVPAAVGKGKRK
jgi:hypothetical protein